MSLFRRLSSFILQPSSFFEGEIARRVSLAVRALDDSTDRLITSSRHRTEGWRDRYDYDRQQVLKDALQAWRINPLARRIVSLTSQYVVGGDLAIESDHEDTHKFLQKWWTHRLNRMLIRSFELCDELTRSGEIFVVLTTDAAGMTYVRAVPAADIDEIITAENDPEQAIAFREKPLAMDLTAARTWQAYDETNDSPVEQGSRGATEQGSVRSAPPAPLHLFTPAALFPPVMLHYAINRPIGAKHGESDLAPMLRWLSRYAAWLEDRARLNRFRQAFVFVLKAVFGSEAEKRARQAELNANPPEPGSILVADSTETWEVISPKLEAHQAGEDGLALKKMIAVGAGTPLHFLAEPESATRTTAEAAGGPTYRHYQQRQLFFLWLLKDIAQIVVRRRAHYSERVSKTAAVEIRGTDISGRDNAALAVAASTIAGAFSSLYDRGLIDEEELLRLSYTFAGEIVDLKDLLKRIRPPRFDVMRPTPTPGAGAPSADKKPTAPGSNGNKPTVKINPETGDLTNVQGS